MHEKFRNGFELDGKNEKLPFSSLAKIRQLLPRLHSFSGNVFSRTSVHQKHTCSLTASFTFCVVVSRYSRSLKPVVGTGGTC